MAKPTVADLQAQLDKQQLENEKLSSQLAAAQKKTPAERTDLVTLTVAKPQPVDLKAEGFKGEFIQHKGDPKNVFGLRIDADARHGRTHQLKSQTHYWDGTEEDFRREFEKA